MQTLIDEFARLFKIVQVSDAHVLHVFVAEHGIGQAVGCRHELIIDRPILVLLLDLVKLRRHFFFQFDAAILEYLLEAHLAEHLLLFVGRLLHDLCHVQITSVRLHQELLLE